MVYVIVEVTPTNLAYIDLTGRFPYRSSRGNKYILVGYNYNGNNILEEPLKNSSATTITEARDSINDKSATAGIQPRT